MENYADRAVNPSQNEGNSLAAGIKHSPDDVIVQLIGEILDQNKGLRDRTLLYLISHAVNRKVKEKRPIDQLLRRKRQRNCHGHLKPLNCFSNISKSARRSVNSAALILKRWLQVSTALLADIALGIALHM